MVPCPCPQYTPPTISPESMEALLAAITGGVKEVQYADKKVVYQSLDDMWRIYRWMEGILQPCSGIGRPVFVPVSYDNGMHRSGFEETEERFRYY